MKPTIEVTSDFVKDVNDIIKKFKRDAVLVGIPAEETARQDDSEPNNATLLALNNFGSPANNIPARPVMALGIAAAQDDIVTAFKQGAKDALTKGLAALPIAYNRVGIIASTSIKKVINSQEGFAPPSPATLAIRKAEGFKGTKALIVTGQMRNAITYVINEGGF